MREQSSVPRWALEHIQDQLGPGEEIINAVSFRQGLLRGLVLLNTSRGAAIVTKGAVGDPRSALLTFPRDMLTFRCDECQARNLLVDAQPPTDLHCTHCGALHHLEGPGAVRARHLKEKKTATSAGRSAGKKSAGKKSVGKKSVGKKSTAKKSTAKKSTAKKSAGKKSTAGRSGKQTTPKRANRQRSA